MYSPHISRLTSMENINLVRLQLDIRESKLTSELTETHPPALRSVSIFTPLITPGKLFCTSMPGCPAQLPRGIDQSSTEMFT